MSTFLKFVEFRESDDLSPKAKEAKREIQIVFNENLDSRINGFGINDIKFELIDSEIADTGIQLDMEAKGSAVAKSKQHVSRMLQKLSKKCREPLWKKNIFLEFMYHQVDVCDNMIENNTPIGLKKTLYFTIVCAAITFE